MRRIEQHVLRELPFPYNRRRRLAHAGEDEIPKLALDYYGNYLVQDLLDATKKLRDSVRQLHKKGKLTEEKAADAVGTKDGIDALGALDCQLLTLAQWLVKDYYFATNYKKYMWQNEFYDLGFDCVTQSTSTVAQVR